MSGKTPCPMLPKPTMTILAREFHMDFVLLMIPIGYPLIVVMAPRAGGPATSLQGGPPNAQVSGATGVTGVDCVADDGRVADVAASRQCGG